MWVNATCMSYIYIQSAIKASENWILSHQTTLEPGTGGQLW